MQIADTIYVIIMNKILGPSIIKGIIISKKSNNKMITINNKDMGDFQTHIKYCYKNKADCSIGLLNEMQNMIRKVTSDVLNQYNILQRNIDRSIVSINSIEDE